MSLLLLFHGGGGAPPPAVVIRDGGKLPPFRWKRKHPEEIAREQRMVEDYLQELEKRAKLAKRIERLPARAKKAAKAPMVSVLTEAIARVASEVQLRRIVEHAQAEKRAKSIAAAEARRRRLLAVMLLAIDD